MQLRTFLAKDMKEALASVRADMGPDAVIIATEKAKSGGVMVRAALDTPEEDGDLAASAESSNAAPPTVADFDLHYRENLLRRLRGGATAKSRPNFDRSELLAALRRHRLPDGLAHALSEHAAKAQLTDMTLALAYALDKSFKTDPLDIKAASALLLVGPNGAGKTAVA